MSKSRYGDTSLSIAQIRSCRFSNNKQAILDNLLKAIECYKSHLIDNPNDTVIKQKLVIVCYTFKNTQIEFRGSNNLSFVENINMISICLNGLEYCDKNINDKNSLGILDLFNNGLFISVINIKTQYLDIIIEDNNIRNYIFELYDKAIVLLPLHNQKDALIQRLNILCDYICTKCNEIGLIEQANDVEQKKCKYQSLNIDGEVNDIRLVHKGYKY